MPEGRSAERGETESHEPGSKEAYNQCPHPTPAAGPQPIRRLQVCTCSNASISACSHPPGMPRARASAQGVCSPAVLPPPSDPGGDVD